MSEFEKSKTSTWAIVAGIIIVIILIIILVIIYNKIGSPKNVERKIPKQKTVNFLGDTVSSNKSLDISMKPVATEGLFLKPPTQAEYTKIASGAVAAFDKEGLFVSPPTQKEYTNIASGAVAAFAKGNQFTEGYENSQIREGYENSQIREGYENSQIREGYENSQIREGYENSYEAATPSNYRSVVSNAIIKPWNVESNEKWNRGGPNRNVWNPQISPCENSPLCSLELGYTAEGFSTDTSKNDSTNGDDDIVANGITVDEIASNTNYSFDAVGQAALANKRQAELSAQITANLLAAANKKEEEAEAVAKENTFKTFIAAKGGLMEASEPIPYIVVDGKNVAAPGISGLYDDVSKYSTLVTSGSLSAYASKGPEFKGSYNTKSWYGYNPYSSDTEEILPYGNTLFGYRGDLQGAVEDVEDAGAASDEDEDGDSDANYTGDDIDYYHGDGYYSVEDTIAVSSVIAEEAEAAYNSEIQAAKDNAALNQPGGCDPILVYKQLIGLVDNDSDSTTPISSS